MNRTRLLATLLGGILACSLVMAGCGGGEQWEMTVENQAPKPCTVKVTLNSGTPTAEVNGLESGRQEVIKRGDSEVIVNTVTVIYLDQAQVLKPQVDLAPGKRFSIVVGTDGKPTTSIADR